MLLNYGLQQKAPNIVAAPQSYIDKDAVLGLSPSQYEGLKSVGNTGYFYGDNRMYEPYKVPATTWWTKGSGIHSGLGGSVQRQYQPVNNVMGVMQPSRPPSNVLGFPSGYIKQGGAETGTIYRGTQAFRPVNVDVTGFSKSKGDDDIYTYDPSMAYIYANTPRPAPVQTPNIMSFLSAPTPMAAPTGNYGAGRYLGNTGLLGGLDFGLPSGQSANTQGTA